MYMFTVQAKVSLHKREEFLQAIRSLQFNQAEDDGVMNLRLYEHADDLTSFSLIHNWETEEDFARCIGGEKFRVLLGALQVLCEKSEIRLIPGKSIIEADLPFA